MNRPSTAAEIRQSFLDFFRSKQHTVVPSSSLLPDSPNLLFTNAGMNQFVPIFLGQQPCPYKPPRSADTQKCIRAGGKHNDLEDVGLDTYHHTFFEMLGNWSFGDYFKKEAIDWAWELLVKVWGFPPQRLFATYFEGDDKTPADTEARELWKRYLPDDHILPGRRKDNFWMMGDTGPCGPNSEIHMDLTPDADGGAKLVNSGSPFCIEIWNLVFIQYNANADGSLAPLPAKHVDTGMGFERVCSIIQCTQGFKDFTRAISNYETDLFRPLFDRIESLSGKRYASTLPKGGAAQEQVDVAFRVVADHIRAVAFSIADGIPPGNTDRNYVVRRILRRAVRYGRALGFHQPFFYKLVDVLAETMGDVFPEIRAKRPYVQDVIRVEEEAFNRTLDRGIELFVEEAEAARNKGIISGDFAFKLYDTYGFPLDLTQLMAREQGLAVDIAGFEKLMEQQRARARAAQKKQAVEISQVKAAPTTFVGFEQLATTATVLDILDTKGRTAVILDVSPCYAEMGGQVGDTGELFEGVQLWPIVDTQKAGAVWLHFIEGGDGPVAGSAVDVLVDTVRRNAIQRHHTVTHIFHWALHEVVSREASQKGSYVGPDKLTFDFNHAPLTPAQIADIERLVNERILENAPVSWTEVPYDEVKSRKDVMQFFGDKYGDRVRVVQIGGKAGALDGYSMELCGGTHTKATGELGLFRIVAESSVAAGVRRIEAVCGEAAYAWTRREHEVLKNLSQRLTASPDDVLARVEALLDQARKHEKVLREKNRAAALDQVEGLLAAARTVNGIKFISGNVGELDPDAMRNLADALRKRAPNTLILLGARHGDKAFFIAAADDATVAQGVHCGKLVGAVAKIAGGGGGGKPNKAEAGGKDVGRLDDALAALPGLL